MQGERGRWGEWGGGRGGRDARRKSSLYKCREDVRKKIIVTKMFFSAHKYVWP